MSRGWFRRRGGDGDDDDRDERRGRQRDSNCRDRELRRRFEQDQTYQERIGREIDDDDHLTHDPDHY